MATLQQITSPVWSLGIGGFGQIATGLSCVRQRIDLAIRTSKGTDPCRPLFGSDVYKYVDAPVTVAIPNIKKAIIDAVGLWVPEVTIKSITHKAVRENLQFFITYLVTDSEISDSLLYDTIGGTLTGNLTGLILYAFIPENELGANYVVYMELSKAEVAPPGNIYGHETMQELYAWVKENWGYLADWYMTPDRLIAYVKDKSVTEGALRLSLTGIVRIEELFPELFAGESYAVSVETGLGETRVLEGTFYSVGQVLAAVQAAWSDMGDWRAENTAGEFNADFNDDFIVGGTWLVLYTSAYPDADITIVKVTV